MYSAGLPRLRLPSRNWSIFLGAVGAFAGAIAYDRREKKRIQKKWCDLVSHLAQDPLPINQMRRKLTIFLAAPPGDGLRPTRDYFRQYIKPVLVAAAVDYDVIEGRKEGDVRYGTAEQIRRRRRKNGENDQNQPGPPDVEQLVDFQRSRMGIQEEPGPKGDLVIGRHAWKEYVRGVHEGWLGPLEQPVPPKVETPTESEPSLGTEDKPPSADEKSDAPKEPVEEAKPVDPKASYLATSAYPESSLAPTTPATFEPAGVLPQPHILGFLNTPIRIYRYLNQRSLADKVGRETAAIVLGMASPFQPSSTSSDSPSSNDGGPAANPSVEATRFEGWPLRWELKDILEHEEEEWHKSVRKLRDDGFERTWLDDVVVDSRILQRMRKFTLDPAEEDRAERIAQGLEKPIGYRENGEDRKVIVDNLDDTDA